MYYYSDHRRQEVVLFRERNVFWKRNIFWERPNLLRKSVFWRFVLTSTIDSLPLRSWRCCIVGSILISIERPCLLLRISPRGTRWYTRDHVDKCCISLQMASLACQNISACPPFVYSTLESTRVGYQQAWIDDALHRLTRKWSDNTT